MFSSRTPSTFAPNQLSLRLQALRDGHQPLLDLTESNPTRAGIDYPNDAILSSMTGPECLSYKPDPKGLEAARETIAGYYRDTSGLSIATDRLVLTASTSEAYAMLLKLLADPGDAVLIPSPSYPLFQHLLALEGVRAIPYPARFDGAWHIDPGALPSLIVPEARALIVVNPNNPTGAYLKRDEMGMLAALCREHDLALISDEVFSDYSFAPDPERVPTVAACSEVLCFSLGGLSKLLGLPQMKLAWILANGPERLCRSALEGLEFIADTYLSVGTPVQVGLPSLFTQRQTIQAQIRKRLAQNLATLTTLFPPDTGVTLLPSEGGWYQVLRFPRVVSEESAVLELLDKDGVLVHPGFFFDFPTEGYFVISLLTHPDVLEEGAARLRARVLAWVGRSPGTS